MVKRRRRGQHGLLPLPTPPYIAFVLYRDGLFEEYEVHPLQCRRGRVGRGTVMAEGEVMSAVPALPFVIRPS